MEDEQRARVEEEYTALQTRVDEEASSFHDLKAGIVRFEAAVPPPITTPTSTAGTHSRSTSITGGAPPSRNEFTEEERQQYDEARAHSETLVENMRRMRAMLEDIKEAKATELQLARRKRHDDAMMNAESGSTTTRKRRADDFIGSSTHNDGGDDDRVVGTQQPPVLASPEEIQHIRDLLQKCIKNMSDARGDLDNMSDEARDAVTGILDVKLQDIRDQKQAVRDAKQRVDEKAREEMNAEVKKAAKEIAETSAGLDEQLAEVSGTLIGLVQQTGQIEGAIEQEKKETLQGRPQIDQVCRNSCLNVSLHEALDVDRPCFVASGKASGHEEDTRTPYLVACLPTRRYRRCYRSNFWTACPTLTF